MRPTNEQVAEAYQRTGSVWKASHELGISAQTVHNRMTKTGQIKPLNRFTPADDARLERDYLHHRNAGTLATLAAEMARTVPFICRQARRLGLTDPGHSAKWLRVWKGMAEAEARVIFEEFKRDNGGLGTFCEARGFDDLGFSRTMQAFFPDEFDAANPRTVVTVEVMT